ncbi:9012_t:CDS:2, partial [Paraglomus occultum]
SYSPIQTDVTIEVAADASSPDLMASESISTKIASVGRELYEKVSTMPPYKGAIVGMVAAPVLIPPVVAAAGFTTAGITAGSWAATIMASYAGYVPAGSACAVLQSIGAAGLGTTGTAMGGAVGH